MSVKNSELTSISHFTMLFIKIGNWWSRARFYFIQIFSIYFMNASTTIPYSHMRNKSSSRFFKHIPTYLWKSKYLLKILGRRMHILLLPSAPKFRKSCWNFPYGDNFKLLLQQHVVGVVQFENLLKILFYHEYQGDTQMLDLIENKFMYHGGI